MISGDAPEIGEPSEGFADESVHQFTEEKYIDSPGGFNHPPETPNYEPNGAQDELEGSGSMQKLQIDNLQTEDGGQNQIEQDMQIIEGMSQQGRGQECREEYQKDGQKWRWRRSKWLGSTIDSLYYSCIFLVFWKVNHLLDACVFLRLLANCTIGF